MAKDRARYERKVTTLLQEESRWLQKAIFALGKAQDAREKLADTRDVEFEPLSLHDGEESVTIGTVKDSVTARVETLMEMIQERRQQVVR